MRSKFDLNLFPDTEFYVEFDGLGPEFVYRFYRGQNLEQSFVILTKNDNVPYFS